MSCNSKAAQNRTVTHLFLLNFIPSNLCRDVGLSLNQKFRWDHVSSASPVLQVLHLLHRKRQETIGVLILLSFENTKTGLASLAYFKMPRLEVKKSITRLLILALFSIIICSTGSNFDRETVLWSFLAKSESILSFITLANIMHSSLFFNITILVGLA